MRSQLDEPFKSGRSGTCRESTRRDQPNMRDRKYAVFAAAAISLSISLVLISAELGVRLFSPRGYITPETLREDGLIYEPVLFARHVFPQRARTVHLDDGRRWNFNSLGFRGPEIALEKPPGVFRVVIYGGSAVFDQDSTLDQDWPHRVERLLREQGSSSVQVINAGIPGHASFDSLGRLFTEGHHFTPDVVVLYNAWNDIKYFTSERPLLREIGVYDPTADPRLNYNNFLDAWLSRASQLYVRLRSRYYNWALDVGPEGAHVASGLRSELNELAIGQYELSVKLFVDTAHNIGALPVLVTQARLVAQENTADQRERISYRMAGLDHETLVRAFEATDAILRRVGEEKGVLVIDASARMTGHPEFFSDHVHVSPEGSAALARVVAESLEPLLPRDAARTDLPEGSAPR
jgi:hypothetical protein